MTHSKERKLSNLNCDEAEIIALKSITFLAEDPKRLLRFMTITGIDLEQLTENAGQISCLVAALDYLRSDESLLLMFATNHALSVKAICQARDILERSAFDEAQR